jgi:segregation and condensation protein B
MRSSVAKMRVIVGSKKDEEERAEELRILEAILFAADEPLDEKVLAVRLPAGIDAQALLLQLQKEYAARGVNLVRVGGKWSLRTASDLAWLLTHETVVTRKLSRAALETLAIVAYHQPVTRAEIEEIRGVTTSKGTLDVLLETGWIRLRGRRKAPGRPVTYGTTEAFMSHFGLDALATTSPASMSSKGRGSWKNRCRPASPCRCRPTILSCGKTKTPWNRAISIWDWRRRPGVARNKAVYYFGVKAACGSAAPAVVLVFAAPRA